MSRIRTHLSTYSLVSVFSLVVATLLATGCEPVQTEGTVAPEPVVAAPAVQVEQVKSPVPHPSELRAEVVLSGRTSTLKHVDVVAVGNNIPHTYSDGRVTNSPKFSWYVSKHYALKTDLGPDNARHHLELLEMSYPMYVEMFGAEPAGIADKRMALVYASSKEKISEAMMDDGFTRGMNAGGETMFYNRVGYNYKSHRYGHQRYIVIHESAHEFQMTLTDYSGWTPLWYIEGIADSLAHHVYDEKRKELTFYVFDRAASSDYLKYGLDQYEEAKQPSFMEIHDAKELRRGLNFLMVHYLLDDAERAQRFRIWRDEMFRLRFEESDMRRASRRLMLELYGNEQELNANFEQWLNQLQKTFNRDKGPWEQNGNRLWCRPIGKADYWPRIDVNLPLNQRPSPSRVVMDYPAPTPTSLVGEVARGGAQPSVGFLIDYHPGTMHRGQLGIDLGFEQREGVLEPTKVGTKKSKRSKAADKGARKVEPKTQLQDHAIRVFVESGETLVVDGSGLGLETVTVPLSTSVRDFLAASSEPQLGINVKIGDTLEVTARVDPKQATPAVVARLALTAEVRSSVLASSIGVISRGASHAVTPYFDDGRVIQDLSVSRTGNRFANNGDYLGTRLAKVQWRMGTETPVAVNQLRDALLASIDRGEAAQVQQTCQASAATAELASSIAAIGTPEAKQALADLSGITARLEWGDVANGARSPIIAVVRNPSTASATGLLSIAVGRGATLEGEANEMITVPAGGEVRVKRTVLRADSRYRANVAVNSSLRWEGQEVAVSDENFDRSYEGLKMHVEQSQTPDGKIVVTAVLQGPWGGKTKGKIFFDAFPVTATTKSSTVRDASVSPYETKRYVQTFERVAGQPFSVRVRAELDAEGEPLRFSEQVDF